MAFSHKIFHRVTTASALTFAIATQIGISSQGVAMDSSISYQNQKPLIQSLLHPSTQDTLNAYQNIDVQNSCFAALDGMAEGRFADNNSQSCDPDVYAMTSVL